MVRDHLMAVLQVDHSAVDRDCRSQVAVGRVAQKVTVSKSVGRLVVVGDVAGFVARTVAVADILVLKEDLAEGSSVVEVPAVDRHKEAVAEAGTFDVTTDVAGSEIAADTAVETSKTREELRSLGAL